MIGFRIILAPDLEFSDRELDWVEDSHQWRLSDKEHGSVTWEFDRNPNISALEGSGTFSSFLVNSLPWTQLVNRTLLNWRTYMHNITSRRESGPCSVEVCGQHWIVYKRSSGMWLKYGRKCAEGGWWLGVAVTDAEAMGTLGELN